jgi:hypothetical protein
MFKKLFSLVKSNISVFILLGRDKIIFVITLASKLKYSTVVVTSRRSFDLEITFNNHSRYAVCNYFCLICALIVPIELVRHLIHLVCNL